MGKSGYKVPRNSVFPPVPKSFKPNFLIGKNAIKASVTLELNAIFNNDREIPSLKEALRISLWLATVSGTDKIE